MWSHYACETFFLLLYKIYSIINSLNLYEIYLIFIILNFNRNKKLIDIETFRLCWKYY